MNAETLSRALGGRRTGNHWMAPCPTHQDRDPSLSIRDADDGKVLVYCHAGCDQSLVVSELRSRRLWDDAREYRRRPTRKQPPKTSSAPQVKDDSDRTASALRLWQLAVPGAGSSAEAYLHSRGIDLAVPASVRFHPRLKHPSGGGWPGMVALVTRGPDGQVLAIHRTFLTPDGGGKAPVSPQKMMLGPCRGGAVRLAIPSGKLMVGEGIETCLSVMQATGLPAWAALSAPGLRALDLPLEVTEITVLADGDEVGEAAAQYAAKRWRTEGRQVRIAHPGLGSDFNDLLLDARHASMGA